MPFELYHASLVVLGIADGQEYVAPRAQGQNMLGSFTGALEKLRADYASSLVHQIIVFDHEISDNPLPEGLIAIPPAGQDKQSSIRSTMCDLTAILLYEMASYGKSLQQVSNIDTPGPSLNAATTKVSRPESSPLGSPGSRSSSPVQGIDKNPYRSSLPAHVSSALTAQGQGSIDRARSPSDGVRSPPVTFDEINGVPDRSAAGSTTDPTNRLKERVPVQGFGSGSLGERARNKAKSRVGVIIGSMYILAGKWLEAINELAESGTAARANSDHVWHAKALDYILVALLMAAWAGVDVDVSFEIVISIGTC